MTIIKGELMQHMTAQQVKQILDDANRKIVLIDVREPHELVNGLIEGAITIPMNDIPNNIEILTKYKTDTVVLICRSGKRSAHVGEYLDNIGFSDTINMECGMNSWAADIDSSMTVY